MVKLVLFSTHPDSGHGPFWYDLESQICPGLNANEMHALYNKHHKVSSLIKVDLNTHYSVKYEVV